MSDSVEKKPEKANYDWSMTVWLDREQKEYITIRGIKIGFSVYKAVKPYFSADPDKALRILVNDVVINEDKQKALDVLDSDNFEGISSMESGFATFVSPMPAEVKKK